jgi:hypothetical protein
MSLLFSICLVKLKKNWTPREVEHVSILGRMEYIIIFNTLYQGNGVSRTHLIFY